MDYAVDENGNIIQNDQADDEDGDQQDGDEDDDYEGVDEGMEH